MVSITKLIKDNPLYAAGAAALGGYLLLRKRRAPPAFEGVVSGYGSSAGISSGPRVYLKSEVGAPTTTGPTGTGPRVIRAPFDGDPVKWVTITNWDDETKRSRRIGDMLSHGIVRVSVIASVPVVPGWIKIGKSTYTYCNGPGNVKAIVSKILALTTMALDKGVESAAPKWSAVAKIVGNMLKKIPSLVERSRQKKWLQWRQDLDATTEFASRDWGIAKRSLGICRVWKYEGPWAGTDIELPLTEVLDDFPTIEIPWKDGARDLTGCLDGEAPSVTISAGGQLRVTILKPDVGPPGACEARYDVSGRVASD
jgi:hypothetical protein